MSKKKPANVPVPLPLGDKELKIKVCIPDYRPMHPLMKRSVERLVTLETFKWKVETFDTASIPFARNHLIRDASKFDYILFVDTDVAFTVTDFLDILKYNEPIICGAYKHAYEERYVGGFSGDKHKMLLTEKGMASCEWVGMGFTLIQSSELKDVVFEMPAKDGRAEFEDYNFCMKKPDKVFINFDTKVQHIEREMGVYLEKSLWADVLKAVIEHPLPYIRSSKIIQSLKSYLE